jgi:lipopolysaccharide export system permease protein
MKRLHFYVIKTYLGPLVMTFFIALFVLLMQFVWLYVDDMIGKGLEISIILKLLFYASMKLVPMALPLSILLASLMTFGALGEKYELVAIKSIGVSIGKIMRPLIVLSVFISIFAFYFSNNILPVVYLKYRVLLWDIQKKKLSINFQDGVFNNSVGDFVIRIGKKEKDGQRIKDILIYDHSKRRENVSVTRADSGKMMIAPNGQELIFILYSGESYQEAIDKNDYAKTHEFRRIKFDMQYKRFDLSDFEMGHTDAGVFKNNYQMYDLPLLKSRTDSLIRVMDNRERKYIQNITGQFSYFQGVDSIRLSKYGDDTLYIRSIFKTSATKTKEKILTEAQKKIRIQRLDMESYQEIIENKKVFIRKHQAEWHKKFTLPIAALLLFFIGAPLGAIIRKGGFGYPLIIAVLLFIIYHILSTTAEKSVINGIIDANSGMWIASFILLPLGIYLTYIATVDASVMDRDAWNKAFNKISAFLLRKKH